MNSNGRGGGYLILEDLYFLRQISRNIRVIGPLIFNIKLPFTVPRFSLIVL